MAGRSRSRWAALGAVTLIALALPQFAAPMPAAAQVQAPAEAPLRVVTRIVPPFVVKADERLTGFSVELMALIANDMGRGTDISVTPSLPLLLDAVRSGKADLAIAAISITAEREQQFDFSQPIFESGLQIMVPTETIADFGRATGLFAFVRSRTFLELLGLLLVLVLVPAHVVWLFERRRDGGLVADKRYVPGVFKAAWWAAATLGGQADEMPRSPLGRVVAVIWMFIGVLFVAYFTAAVTTSMTVRQLQGEVAGLGDLPGKRVATITGSTSAAYLSEHHADALAFATVAEATRALADGRVSAFVFDAPVLLYYAAHEGSGKVHVVGPSFRKENYGIMFPPGSPYRKPVNAALLRLRESGRYDQLYEKWFGGATSAEGNR